MNPYAPLVAIISPYVLFFFLSFFSQVADPHSFLFILHHYPPPKKDKLSRPLINFFFIQLQFKNLRFVKASNKPFFYPITIRELKDLSKPLIIFFYPITIWEPKDLSCIKINNKEWHNWFVKPKG